MKTTPWSASLIWALTIVVALLLALAAPSDDIHQSGSMLGTLLLRN